MMDKPTLQRIEAKQKVRRLDLEAKERERVRKAIKEAQIWRLVDLALKDAERRQHTLNLFKSLEK